jgi:hypothetical protein
MDIPLFWYWISSLPISDTQKGIDMEGYLESVAAVCSCNTARLTPDCHYPPIRPSRIPLRPGRPLQSSQDNPPPLLCSGSMICDPTVGQIGDQRQDYQHNQEDDHRTHPFLETVQTPTKEVA